MLGASYYVATLTDAGNHANRGQPLDGDQLVQRVAGDALTHVVQRMLFSDGPHGVSDGPLLPLLEDVCQGAFDLTKFLAVDAVDLTEE